MTRIVIGEDEVLLREGLILVLEKNGFEVVAVAGDALTLVREVERTRPDLVITDIRMPPENTDDGLRAALAIREANAQQPIIVLSQHVSRGYAMELLDGDAGSIGYLLKQRVTDIREFVSLLHVVLDGGTVVDPVVVSAMVSKAKGSGGAVASLTVRQREVLTHMAEGRSNQWIADELVLSEKAVVKHISNVYNHLGLQVGPDDHRRVLAVIHHLNEQ